MDPIQYGPSQLGEGNIQDGAHDHVAGLTSRERQALQSVIQNRGEKATARKVREENDRHFREQLGRLNVNGGKLNHPVFTIQNEVNQGGNARTTAISSGTEMTFPFALVGGDFAEVTVNIVRYVLD